MLNSQESFWILLRLHLYFNILVTNIRNRTRFGALYVIQKLANMNFFEKESRTSERVDAQGLVVISTRAHIVLFIIGILLLRFFNGFATVMITGTALSPPITTFEKLHIIYPNPLSCACQRIAVPYDSFPNIKPIYHQVRFMN
jgi:hypothetical protein